MEVVAFTRVELSQAQNEECDRCGQQIRVSARVFIDGLSTCGKCFALAIANGEYTIVRGGPDEQHPEILADNTFAMGDVEIRFQ